MNTYRAYWNARQINDKRLYTGALTAINSVLDITIATTSLPSEEEVLNIFTTNLTRRMLLTYKEGVRNGLNSATKKWGGVLPPLKKRIGLNQDSTIQKDVSANEISRLGITNDREILHTHCIKQVKTISSSLHGLLRAEFDQSIQLGESQTKLIERIRGIKDQATWKARRIAQTESTRLYNGGSMLGYEKSTVVKGKEWTANIMGNVRPAHREANGKTVPLKKPFTVMGENLMYPGDPAGSAENTINCHCGIIPFIIKPEVTRKPPSVASEIRKDPAVVSGKFRRFYDSDEFVDSTLQAYYSHPLNGHLRVKPIGKWKKDIDDTIDACITEAEFKPGTSVANSFVANDELRIEARTRIRESVEEYTGAEYTYLRNYQYDLAKRATLSKEHETANPDAYKRAYSYILDRLSTHSTVKEDTLYRGIHMKRLNTFQEFRGMVEETKEIPILSYTSTSTAKDRAMGFSGADFRDKSTGRVVLEINNCKDKLRGLNIAKESSHPNEMEVLIGGGQNLVVDEIVDLSDEWQNYIYIKCHPGIVKGLGGLTLKQLDFIHYNLFSKDKI